MRTLILSAVTMAACLAVAPIRAEAQGKPSDKTIVEIALDVNAADGEFDYLLGAVGCLTDEEGNNAVVDLLSQTDDAYTLFAPTDQAFIDLQTTLGVTEPSPEATCALGEDVVFDVLAYHVRQGRRFSNSVFNRKSSKSLTMLNGDKLRTNPNLTLTDVAGQSISVVPPLVNLNARNGVVHVIDGVLLPFVP